MFVWTFLTSLSPDAWSAMASWAQVLISGGALFYGFRTVRSWLHEHRAVHRSEAAAELLVSALAYLDAVRDTYCVDPLDDDDLARKSFDATAAQRVFETNRRRSEAHRMMDLKRSLSASFRNAIAVLDDPETKKVDEVMHMVAVIHAHSMPYWAGLADATAGWKPPAFETVEVPLRAALDQIQRDVIQALTPIARMSDHRADPKTDIARFARPAS